MNCIHISYLLHCRPLGALYLGLQYYPYSNVKLDGRDSNVKTVKKKDADIKMQVKINSFFI